MARGATARDKAAKATEPGSSTSILITGKYLVHWRRSLYSPLYLRPL